MRAVVSGVVVVLLWPWAAVAGQQDTLAAIRGSVTSAFDGRPLSGVMIAVPTVGRFAVTDSTGTFVLGRLPSGKQRVRISYLERGSADHDVPLRRGKVTVLAVLLDVEAVDLAPVVVEAWGFRFERSLAGFYDRRRRGFGTFYSWEDIDRIRPYRLSSLLRQAGVLVQCSAGECLPYALAATRRCPMAVYLDGLPIDGVFLDTIDPAAVAGVEIYRRASQVPFEFVGLRDGCGVVAVWSRT
jgi:hypothetical protein